MGRTLRISLVVAALAIVAVAGLLVWTYLATQQVPEFYRQATAADGPKEEQASDEMLQRATALVNDARREGRWEAVFSEAQINGWLAVDLEQNHGELLPAGVSDPRVHIAPDGAVLACRWQEGKVSTVLSLELGIYLADRGKLAMRIKAARAGDLPLPLDQVVQAVNRSAADLNAPVEWFEADGDPVAAVALPMPSGDEGAKVLVDALELRDGQVYVAGRTAAADAVVAGTPETNSRQ